MNGFSLEIENHKIIIGQNGNIISLNRIEATSLVKYILNITEQNSKLIADSYKVQNTGIDSRYTYHTGIIDGRQIQFAVNRSTKKGYVSFDEAFSAMGFNVLFEKWIKSDNGLDFIRSAQAKYPDLKIFGEVFAKINKKQWIWGEAMELITF